MDDNVKPAQTLAHATPETAKAVAGRRSFFNYLDLGVTDASNGAMRAQITKATQGLGKPTGWHYHACDQQLVYMLKGWVDLEFEDGRKIRLNAGDSLMIPGGMRHNETATADELELLEISVPAKMDTVPCDPPTGFTTG
jgi:quercetin dioxygenase-like cupin family protein